MSEYIPALQPPTAVGPADLQLPPTQPIDITDLVHARPTR